ncbi:MAG: PAS domain S-box protein [Polaromonas sp.]|nr:PAS domain S-box protein [Polaromonas sp.]
MKTSTPVRINLALGLGAAMVLLVAVAAYSTIDELIGDAQQSLKVQQSTTLLERVGRSLANAESTQRRFLIEASDEHLFDYEEARSRVVVVLSQLRAADAVNAADPKLPALAGSVDRRLGMLDEAVRARRAEGLTAASMVVNSDLNRQLKEEIDSLSELLAEGKMQDLARAQAASQSDARQTELLIAGGGLLTLVLIIGALRSVNHYHATQQRAEDQLRDSEAMSRAVTRSMAEGVVTTGVDGVITEANPAALKLFAYSRDEILGRQVTHLVPERYRGQFDMLLDDLRERKSGFSEAGREVMAMRKDGSEFPVIVSFGDVVVAGKRLFSAIVHDITERVRSEEALQASEYQLRQITDSVPALIAYLDRDGRYIFHNKAYGEVIGPRVGAIVGKTLQEVLGEALYQDIRPNVERVLAGQTVSYERTQRSAVLGERDYAVSYVPRYEAEDQQGRVTGFFAMATDITDMKRMDRMKSEFVSTVSHELRTPLTSIRGSLGLIAGGIAGPLPPAAQGLVDIAKNNCERLIRLINDILDIEKIESGQMRLALQTVPLQPLLLQAIAANEGFAGQHGVTLRLQAPDAAVLASVDTDRLTQVLTNLLSNAVKFSPRSGVVEITLSGRAERVRVEVRDHGPGIPKEFRQRIFQKFSQADSSDTRQKGGTGLGLNISKAIVERMGGSIGFDKAQGGGTIFFFELPRIHEPQALAPSTLARPVAQGTRPRILVCEGDRDVARLIVLMLEKAGFDADVAHSADRALAMLAEQPFAAMTVDLTLLPDQDGAALITAVRRDAHTANLPIVVISVSAEQGRQRPDHQGLGVADWIEKPINEHLMVRSLRGAIQGVPGGRPRILHVEDDLDIQRIAAAITQEFATFEFATSVQEARTALRAQHFDLVLLDLSLPGGSGWDLFPDIDALPHRPPVVVFSATDVTAADDRGAAAILVKAQTSNEELLSTIQRVLKTPSPSPATLAAESGDS